jgi:hypothetical protein
VKSAPLAYRKLPGGAWSAAGYSRLWLADDHLLEANSLLVVERYHRFFLRDIRAVIIEHTKVGRWLNIALGSFVALSALGTGGLAFSAQRAAEGDGQVVLWIFVGLLATPTLVLLALLAVNLVRGPTCRCVVHTMAGAHPLEGAKRLRRARRLLAELAPLIEAAQLGASSFSTAAR